VEDSSYGTQQILTGPVYLVTGLPAQPYLWDGQHYHDQVASEMRLSFDPIHNISGTVGVYYANTHSRFTIPPTLANGLDSPGTTSCSFGSPGFPCTVMSPAWPNNEIWQQTNPGTEEDKSLFGEVYWKFLPQWTLTLGGRQYWLHQTTDYTADGFLNGGPTPSQPEANSESGFNPKVALSLQATDSTMVYASASKGFRSGGAQANFPGRLVAVHHRHLAVHEDNVISTGLPCANGLGAVAHDVYLVADFRQRLASHFLVHQIILSQQDQAMVKYTVHSAGHHNRLGALVPHRAIHRHDAG